MSKIIAVTLSAVMLLTFAACANTRWAFKIDGMEIRAGIYIYYAQNAYYSALSALQEKDPKFDVNDAKAIKKAILNDMPLRDYVEDEAIKQVKRYVAVLRDFDEKELALTVADGQTIENNVENSWASYSEVFVENGIGKESVRDIETAVQKSNVLFEKYYAYDGLEKVTEDDMKTYFKDTFARVRYMVVELKDDMGVTLEGTAKDAKIEEVKDYADSIDNVSEFDEVQSEITSISEEISVSIAQSQSLAETDASGATVYAPDYFDTTTTTEPITTEPTTTEATTTLGTTSELGTDENGSEVTTTEPTTTTEGTTTTTPSYDGEEIVRKVTTTDEKNITEDLFGEVVTVDPSEYVPNKVVHDEIFVHDDDGKAFAVEDTENAQMYIVARYDMQERMTDEDLWSTDVQNSIRQEVYSSEFQSKLDQIANLYEFEKNKAALKRYNPLKFFVATEASPVTG
jgi:hypothetical protein